MDKRLEVLRRQRDEIQNATAKREAEKERRLANARAKGGATGNEWARGSAHYTRLKQLSEGLPDVIEAEVWDRIENDEVVTRQEWLERAKAPVAQAYLAAFTEAVNEVLQKVDEEQTKTSGPTLTDDPLAVARGAARPSLVAPGRRVPSVCI